jgi:5-methylthioribose kinase
LFYEKSLKILKEEASDRTAKTEGFAEWYMDGIMADTAGMAGMEINRRIIGIAKVKDIAGIEDSERRKTAERICVLCAKEFILKRGEKYRKGKEYVDTMKKIALQFRQGD